MKNVQIHNFWSKWRQTQKPLSWYLTKKSLSLWTAGFRGSGLEISRMNKETKGFNRLISVVAHSSCFVSWHSSSNCKVQFLVPFLNCFSLRTVTVHLRAAVEPPPSHISLCSPLSPRCSSHRRQTTKYKWAEDGNNRNLESSVSTEDSLFWQL